MFINTLNRNKGYEQINNNVCVCVWACYVFMSVLVMSLWTCVWMCMCVCNYALKYLWDEQ